jgi:signal recognition particle receptor subunit beta
MAVFNYSGAELNAKIVYYGPALSGKTTNLEFIYDRMPDDAKGKMVSMKTRTDRTLFFDFLPLDVGEINGYRTRILLYTVPGQVYYNATRKLVLKGADAVVFVADSQASMMQENIDSLRNLEENLNEHGLTLDTMPWVIQYNKRDLPDALPIETLNSKLNLLNVPSHEAVAATGHGIYETFRAIAGLLYRELVERLKNTQPAPRAGAAPPPETEDIQTAAHGEPAGPAAGPPLASAPRPVADREAEAPPPRREQPAAEPAGAPPAGSDQAPSVDDVSVVVDSALREVEPDVVVTRTATEPGPPQRAPGEPPQPLRAKEAKTTDDSVDKDFQFASLEGAEEMDEAVGRVVDFEDTEVEESDDSRGGDFIVDPFQKKAAEPELRKDVPSAPRPASTPPPAPPSPTPEQDATPVTVTVPVYIRRSQMHKTVPIRIELEIQVGDEER